MANNTEQPIIDGKSFNTNSDVTFGKVKLYLILAEKSCLFIMLI